jgi:hypothetical protein
VSADLEQEIKKAVSETQRERRVSRAAAAWNINSTKIAIINILLATVMCF